MMLDCISGGCVIYMNLMVTNSEPQSGWLGQGVTGASFNVWEVSNAMQTNMCGIHAWVKLISWRLFHRSDLRCFFFVQVLSLKRFERVRI